jgi:alkylation response protein AidB-like acyl-CoA dehydrogenase
MIPLEEYRAELRAWLPGHLDRRSGRAQRDPYAPGQVAEHRAIQRRLFDAGYAGISWPSEYGGGGLPPEYERAFTEEAEDFVTPHFGTLSVTTFGSCVPTMLRHADPEYLIRHVPATLKGERLWCQFFSEPTAGSDLAGIRTTARRDPGGWRLNGAKVWSSLANIADWGMCLARTDSTVPKHQGLTWFAVPTDAKGLTVRPLKQITGNSEFCEESFEEVLVAEGDRIGPVNGGWTITSTLLVFERGAGRPDAEEFPDRPGPLPPDLVQLARRAGRAADVDTRRLIVSTHIDGYAVSQLRGRIATLTRLGRVSPGVASYAKLLDAAATAARGRAQIEIGGLAATTWAVDDPASGAPAAGFLGSKAPSIAGGTEQVQRNAVAERVLGLPREPAYDVDVPFKDIGQVASRWRPKSQN